MVALVDVRPAYLPVSSTEHQEVWLRNIYTVYARQGFGDHLPERWHLEPHHLADLQKSGISAIDAAAAGICSVGPIYLERLGLTVGRNPEPLLVFFYLDPWGTPYTWIAADGQEIPFCRAKLNRTRGNQKYTQAKGSGIFPYFPQVAAGRIEGWSTWGQAANMDEQEHVFKPYPQTDALITEGEKKALKATLDGFPCIGLGGVWNFKGEWSGVHDDLGKIAAQLRALTLIYDNDCATKPQVVQAANALLKGLVEGQFSPEARTEEAYNKLRSIRNGVPPTRADAGAIADKLHWTLLPQTLAGDKIGLDDLLVQPRGAELLRKLITNRLPGIVTIEEGKDKEGNPKRVTTHPAYMAEPLGDEWLVKHLPKNRQEHLRRVLTEAGMVLSNVMPVQGNYPYKWDAKSLVWRFMSKDEWESLPLALADRHQWVNRQGALVSTCAAELKKHAQPAEAMNPMGLIGFLNGDYNPATGELLPIHPSHMLTNRVNVEWVPGAGCTQFLQWLSWMWEKPTLTHQVELFRAALRWTLEPKLGGKKYGAYSNSIEAIFGLVGPAGRGKGSLLDVIWSILGENAAKSFSLIDCINPNAMADLVGQQCCIDTDQKGRLNEMAIGALNKIASNEPLPVKILYKDAGQARLNTVLWFAANRMPQAPSNAEDTEGWLRRFIPLVCERKPDSRDPSFLERIYRELPGIVQWIWAMPIADAVATLRNYQESDLPEDQLQDRLECHTIYLWLSELLGSISDQDLADSHVIDSVTIDLRDVQAHVKDGYVFAKYKHMHNAYVYWCELNKEKHPFGLSKFVDQLRAIGVSDIKVGGKRNQQRFAKVPVENIDWAALITGG
jgi:phage/plasmid-associated DNA primase